jgi:hypothetical protein
MFGSVANMLHYYFYFRETYLLLPAEQYNHGRWQACQMVTMLKICLSNETLMLWTT